MVTFTITMTPDVSTKGFKREPFDRIANGPAPGPDLKSSPLAWFFQSQLQKLPNIVFTQGQLLDRVGIWSEITIDQTPPEIGPKLHVVPQLVKIRKIRQTNWHSDVVN